MAKFTIFFKGKVIDTAFLESGALHIGREESNDIQLNSLSVAPAHAAIIKKDNAYVIKQLNEQYPVLVNGEAIKEAVLSGNDKIILGKYTLVYVSGETVNQAEVDDSEDDVLGQLVKDEHCADFQILDGPNIGRMIPLKKALTRIGNNGTGVIAVARRKDGFYVSALEEDLSIMINNQPLGSRMVRLSTNDTVLLNSVTLKFNEG